MLVQGVRWKFQLAMYLVSSNQHMLQLFKELAGRRGLFYSWEERHDAAAASDAGFLVSCAAIGSERPLDPGEASQRKKLTAKGTMITKAFLQDA